MKKNILAILLALSVPFYGVTALAKEPMTPIANIEPSQNVISRIEARWIYTLKTRYWRDGSKITVYHLPLDHPDHEQFVREVLGMRPAEFTKSIQQNMNSGISNVVKEVRNQSIMLDAVINKPGAVGYLTKDYLIVNGLGHVDVLKIID